MAFTVAILSALAALLAAATALFTLSSTLVTSYAFSAARRASSYSKIKINLNFYHSVSAHFLEFDCDGDDVVDVGDDKDNGFVPGSLIPLKALIFEFVWILGLV